MPRIFWTVKKKMEFRKLSKTLTVVELAKHYKRPEDEITRVLAIVRPSTVMVKSVEYVCGIKITKYHPAYGVEPQPTARTRDRL